MTSAPGTELVLQPSLGLAAGLGVVGLTAIGALWAASLPVLVALVGSAGVGIAVAFRMREFIKPSLRIRVRDQRIEFRPSTRSGWLALTPAARAFASPWYIAWHARGLRGYGLFRTQVRANDFRRLLVLLRHRSAD